MSTVVVLSGRSSWLYHSRHRLSNICHKHALAHCYVVFTEPKLTDASSSQFIDCNPYYCTAKNCKMNTLSMTKHHVALTKSKSTVFQRQISKALKITLEISSLYCMCFGQPSYWAHYHARLYCMPVNTGLPTASVPVSQRHSTQVMK